MVLFALSLREPQPAFQEFLGIHLALASFASLLTQLVLNASFNSLASEAGSLSPTDVILNKNLKCKLGSEKRFTGTHQTTPESVTVVPKWF